MKTPYMKGDELPELEWEAVVARANALGKYFDAVQEYKGGDAHTTMREILGSNQAARQAVDAALALPSKRVPPSPTKTTVYMAAPEPISAPGALQTVG